MRLPTALALAGLMVATRATAQEVSWDYAKGTDFTRFKTYAWTDGHPLPDPLIDQRIVGAIEAQLGAKGFTKVAAIGEPDALVAYHAGISTDHEISELGSGWGGFHFGGTWSRRIQVQKIMVGTVVVDLIDAKANTIVWRGTVSRSIDPDAKPQERDKQVTKAMKKLFTHYPGVE
jgi:hypothetical protein